MITWKSITLDNSHDHFRKWSELPRKKLLWENQFLKSASMILLDPLCAMLRYQTKKLMRCNEIHWVSVRHFGLKYYYVFGIQIRKIWIKIIFKSFQLLTEWKLNFVQMSIWTRIENLFGMAIWLLCKHLFMNDWCMEMEMKMHTMSRHHKTFV